MPKKLFIASLPSSVSKKDMHNIFSKYGKIKRVEMVTQKDSNRCKGFAFVTYFSEEVAEQVLDEEIYFQGRRLSIREQLKGTQLKAYKQNFCKRRMFIGNIPSGVTDEELREKFREYGRVETGYLIKDHRTGLNTNFGYILFKKIETLKMVIKMEVKINGRIVSCEEFKGKKSNYMDLGLSNTPKIQKSQKKKNLDRENSVSSQEKSQNLPTASLLRNVYVTAQDQNNLNLGNSKLGNRLSRFSNEYKPSPNYTQNRRSPKNPINRLLTSQKRRESLRSQNTGAMSEEGYTNEVMTMVKIQSRIINGNHTFGNCRMNKPYRALRTQQLRNFSRTSRPSYTQPQMNQYNFPSNVDYPHYYRY